MKQSVFFSQRRKRRFVRQTLHTYSNFHLFGKLCTRVPIFNKKKPSTLFPKHQHKKIWFVLPGINRSVDENHLSYLIWWYSEQKKKWWRRKGNAFISDKLCVHREGGGVENGNEKRGKRRKSHQLDDNFLRLQLLFVTIFSNFYKKTYFIANLSSEFFSYYVYFYTFSKLFLSALFLTFRQLIFFH